MEASNYTCKYCGKNHKFDEDTLTVRNENGDLIPCCHVCAMNFNMCWYCDELSETLVEFEENEVCPHCHYILT